MGYDAIVVCSQPNCCDQMNSVLRMGDCQLLNCILLDLFCCSRLSVWVCCIFLICLLFSIFLGIRAEMMPDERPDRSEVAKFDQSKLKHVKTTEKEVLPTESGAVMGFRQNVRFKSLLEGSEYLTSQERGVGWLRILIFWQK